MKRFVILYFDKQAARTRFFEAVIEADSKEQAVESFASSYQDTHIFKIIELPPEPEQDQPAGEET